MTEQNPENFDSAGSEGRNVAAVAAADREEFLSLMPHYYRGEVSKLGNRLSRLDLTTDWAIVVVTAVLALAFQGGDASAYMLLIGLVGVSLFLVFDVRRYRAYDATRARVRLLEENLFANALQPSGTPLEDWRAELGDDLQTPTIKVSYREALSRRLRRIYFPLFALLGAAWLFRISIYESGEPWTQTASVPGVPGEVVIVAVTAFYLAVTVLTFRPGQRKAKGEFHGEEPGSWK
ncbi:DUF2270 domain-containing protein [Natrinema gelatinilyticum]|uniref:DUF2270 domain-containing protein n=1 Tax=Natrinema gelatinilyticum TaxID=2961571 RepID=UPI0020C3A5D7|nr:DUF2270 domain-containing protein [Natrinema gelatinilyticum]